MNAPTTTSFERNNLTMLTDFYEITMANGFFKTGNRDRITYFDMFFRRIPDGGGYAVMAGVEQLVHYLKNLSFTDEDIAYISRLCDQNNIPFATNLATAEMLIMGLARGDLDWRDIVNPKTKPFTT